MPTLPVTAVTASVLALLFVKLSFAVIALRRQHRLSLVSGGHHALERIIRAHANFAEYTPIALILLACLESYGAPWWLVAAAGTAVVAGRLFHAKEVTETAPCFGRCILGMQLTLSALIGLAIPNLGWFALARSG